MLLRLYSLGLVVQVFALHESNRHLQFVSPSTRLPPPTFTEGNEVFYNCAYDGPNQWCCLESNGNTGSRCWDTNECQTEFTNWSGQNLVCCTDNAAECILTYEQPMPTTTPSATPRAITVAPSTTTPSFPPDSFGVSDTFAPSPPPQTGIATESPISQPTPSTTTQITIIPTAQPSPPITSPTSIDSPRPNEINLTTTVLPEPTPASINPATTAMSAPRLNSINPVTTANPEPASSATSVQPQPDTRDISPTLSNQPQPRANLITRLPPSIIRVSDSPQFSARVDIAPSHIPTASSVDWSSRSIHATTALPKRSTSTVTEPPVNHFSPLASLDEALLRNFEDENAIPLPKTTSLTAIRHPVTAEVPMNIDITIELEEMVPDHADARMRNDTNSIIDTENGFTGASILKTIAATDNNTIIIPFEDNAAKSANMLFATAVATNVLTMVISCICTTFMSSGAIPSGTVPAADFSLLFMMLNYLQFIASGSHLTLPGAPPMYHKFTDSLAWTAFMPMPSRNGAEIGTNATTNTYNEALSEFAVGDGDIISGVLAYAQRVNIKPEQLFTKTVIAFLGVVGSVAVTVAFLYSLIHFFARKHLDVAIQRLNDLPRAKLLVRLMTQSCLSICLMSEYALSLTSTFQMRYCRANDRDPNYSALVFATTALIIICFGLIVLGIYKLHGKTCEELTYPDFKFTWGAYYKYYHYSERYFFIVKMSVEILSGVIIGFVSDVPSQLALLMSLQLLMCLYMMEISPYSMNFQTTCASVALIMKVLTYALISRFLTTATDANMRNFVGMLVVILQLLLLLLFNSRQIYVLFKHIIYILEIRRRNRNHQVPFFSNTCSENRKTCIGSRIATLNSRTNTYEIEMIGTPLTPLTPSLTSINRPNSGQSLT